MGHKKRTHPKIPEKTQIAAATTFPPSLFDGIAASRTAAEDGLYQMSRVIKIVAKLEIREKEIALLT